MLSITLKHLPDYFGKDITSNDVKFIALEGIFRTPVLSRMVMKLPKDEYKLCTAF